MDLGADVTITAQRNPGGRPALPAEQRRTERIETRISPVERADVDAVLQRKGLTESAWAREVLLAAAARELADA